MSLYGHMLRPAFADIADSNADDSAAEYQAFTDVAAAEFTAFADAGNTTCTCDRAWNASSAWCVRAGQQALPYRRPSSGSCPPWLPTRSARAPLPALRLLRGDRPCPH